MIKHRRRHRHRKESTSSAASAARQMGALAVAGAVCLPLLAAPPAAAASLSAVSSVEPVTGFPFWYADNSTRLDLCLDGLPLCLTAGTKLAPPAGEAFYFNAEADLAGAGQLGLATEAAFDPATGQPIVFNRYRLRLDVAEPGTYQVTYPYGVKSYQVASVDAKDQEINDTQDVGCTAAPCDFPAALESGDGGITSTYLRWDPGVAPAAPAGYLGDPNVAHAVTGSPANTNFVEVVRTHDAAGVALAVPQRVLRQDRFFVQGKVARPRVVSPTPSGSYQGAQAIALIGSEPGGQVWYTTDGSAPANADGTRSDTAVPYSATVSVVTDTTIKAVNVDPATGLAVVDPVTGTFQEPSVLAYSVDALAPELTVSPAGGAFTSAPLVTLTATDSQDTAPKVYYNLAPVAPGGSDPADPTSASTLYTGPIAVDGNPDGYPVVLKAVAIDSAGNTTPVQRQSYTVAAPSVAASPRGGSFGTAQRVTLTASDPAAEIRYTTDGSDPSLNGTIYTGPVELGAYTTLKFVASSPAGSSSVQTEVYRIDIPANRTGGSLAGHGPLDAFNNYPFWFGDKGLPEQNIEPVRLELCLEIEQCPMAIELPNPEAPISFPDNYADEGFWWAGEASIERPNGKRAMIVLAQEAAFAGTGDTAVGQQIAFSRQRIRVDGLQPGAQYTVTGPYGVDVFTADADGVINDTQDIGCMTPTCNFGLALNGRVGPFLRWDPAVAPAAPAGFIGDGATDHKVVGSPYNTNYFRIEGPQVGGPGVDKVETDKFVVMGRIAQLRATASPAGDLYEGPQQVRIQASFPQESKMVYTTDGSEPSVDAAGTILNGTEVLPAAGDPAPAAVVNINDDAVLKYIAVDLATGKTSEVYSQAYRIDSSLPIVSASPDGSAILEGARQVALAATTPEGAASPKIYYTTDGTVPRLADGQPQGSARLYEGPLDVTRSTTVTAVATNDAGTAGPHSTFNFTVHTLRAMGPVSAANGFPEWYEDFNGQRVELCLNDASCALAPPFDTTTATFPDNFPDEAFWWSGNASLDTPGGGRARLILAAEAAFANGPVKAGDQIAFGRTRYTMDGLVGGATYRVTHPYGTATLTAEADGSIGYVDDVGCMDAGCTFDKMFESGIGPFLRSADAPAGYLGDGATPGPVTGSSFGTDFFRLEQLSNSSGATLAEPVLVGETSDFVIVGRLAGTVPAPLPPAPVPAPTVAAAPAGGTFTAPQQVTLTASAGAAIHYTLDGSEPTTASPAYTAPITISAEGVTTLKFLAVAGAQQSAVGTEVYTVNTALAGATAPEAPSITALAGGFGDAVLTFTPGGDGGSPITGFLVKVVDPAGNQVGELRPAPADATSVQITGLSAATALRFQVAAVNLAGTGQFSALSAELPPAAPPFPDVAPTEQFFTEIAWLKDRGITTGFPDGTFQPQERVTRGAMAAFLYRLAGSPEFAAPEVSPFKDINSSTQFYKEITWLAANGITTGFTDGSFKPDRPVERNAAAAFMYRFAGSPAYTLPASSRFRDLDPDALFYKEIAWFAEVGITTGFPDNTYRPGQPVNRDAMAAFLYRFDHLKLGQP